MPDNNLWGIYGSTLYDQYGPCCNCCDREYCSGCPPAYSSDNEECIALFTSEELAKQYKEASRLKTPTQSWPGGIYRKKSLLSGYKDLEIRQHSPDSAPEIDPEINF